jgi:hypothetical protein
MSAKHEETLAGGTSDGDKSVSSPFLAAEHTYSEMINEPDQVGRMIESFRLILGTNQMMAYQVMMAVLLKELHRVLKPTGSLYLHCDPTA